MCLRGASAVEDILRSDGQPLRVLVVWEPIILTDVAPPTSATLARISDARAMQYWDRDHVLSEHLISVARRNPSWLRQQDRARVGEDDFVVWDAALVFPIGSRWETTLPPPSFYGGPVLSELDAIEAALRER